ncbi:MAG: ectoine/hydroxyectoine ABC transporter permease subunit EhuD [Nocardioidaceae bacterium]
MIVASAPWNTSFAISIIPQLLEAFVEVTLLVTVLGSVIAAILGLAFAVVRRARVPVLAPLVTAFVEFVRSTPIPVQLVFVFYVLPEHGPRLTAIVTGVIVLGIHYACYYAEVYRAGIEGVPVGQWEACTALSLSPLHKWRLVVLPQAFRNVLPALGNYVISMWKEVPFLVLIAAPTMVQVASKIGGDRFRYVEPFTIAALLFLAVSYPSALAMRKLEKYLGHA